MEESPQELLKLMFKTIIKLYLNQLKDYKLLLDKWPNLKKKLNQLKALENLLLKKKLLSITLIMTAGLSCLIKSMMSLISWLIIQEVKMLSCFSLEKMLLKNLTCYINQVFYKNSEEIYMLEN
jgi:hypothetical protein